MRWRYALLATIISGFPKVQAFCMFPWFSDPGLGEVKRGILILLQQTASLAARG
jgi:hypothetical protein